jgi:hypothetical protein
VIDLDPLDYAEVLGPSGFARLRRPVDVVGVCRDRFRVERSLAAYRQLRSAAQAAQCWEAERVATPAAPGEGARRECGGRYGGPALIDALLDDGDVDAAWHEGRCGRSDGSSMSVSLGAFPSVTRTAETPWVGQMKPGKTRQSENASPLTIPRRGRLAVNSRTSTGTQRLRNG